jgi:signal-transduction protein with cAMP-binding, CBS, and nucleotidyltransferase domain
VIVLAKVEDVMTRSLIIYTKPERHVNRAIATMIHRKIGAILIYDGKEWGIVTRKDVVKNVLAQGRDPKTVRCSEIISKPLITVDRKADLKEAMQLMIKKDIRRLGVTENGKIVGLLSNEDILRSYV